VHHFTTILTAFQTPTPAPFGDDFINFSVMHLITVVACVAVIVALAACGRRCRGCPSERPLRWWWFAFVVVVQVANIVFYAVFIRSPADATNSEPHVDWSVALPLQVCDLAGVLAIPALATRSRLLRTILYYWAIGLTTQAFITPVLGYGPIHMRFWMFWLSHVTITATAVYFLAAEGYRPTWRDFGIITLVMLGYLAVVLPLDLAFGFNYGFVGKAHDLGTRTILDYLGPWPLRLVTMFIVIEAVFALMTVVWHWPARKLRGASPNTVSAS
jgi:hypothetical integral membrane protein (TIGR02206 family)